MGVIIRCEELDTFLADLRRNTFSNENTDHVVELCLFERYLVIGEFHTVCATTPEYD
jgi:hypothetical protein